MTNHEDIASSALTAAHDLVAREVGGSDGGADALTIAHHLRHMGDALIVFRAGVMIARGALKKDVVSLLGYSNTANFSRQYPDTNEIAEAVRRAIIREETTDIIVRGFTLVFDPSKEF